MSVAVSIFPVWCRFAHGSVSLVHVCARRITIGAVSLFWKRVTVTGFFFFFPSLVQVCARRIVMGAVSLFFSKGGSNGFLYSCLNLVQLQVWARCPSLWYRAAQGAW